MQEKDFQIICVDDDLDVLEITKLDVERLGYQAVGFSHPHEAVAYIDKNRHKISMILSDLRMDDVNGFEFKKLLNGQLSDIPFVVVTGYWTKEMSAEAMEVGIDAFIEKPLSSDILQGNLEKFANVRANHLIEEREMVDGFLDETEPMLDEIEQLILELEENPDSDQTLSVYFRLLHTIKGTASCVGLGQLADYTHKYEDFIGELRNKTLPVNTQTTNVLLEGLDDLKKYFLEITNVGNDLHFDISETLGKYDSANFKNVSVSEEDTSIVKEEEVKTDKAQTKKDDDKMTVGMSVLNKFMEESGELTVIRNSILKTVKKIEMKYRGDDDIEQLNELLDGMYNVTSNIQGKITEMRKVPLANTFRPFKRLVRDLSKQLNKKVELEIEGDHLSVDNVVAKLYSNTLIHILRNSLDHGLESPNERVDAGKEETGLLKIKTFEEGEDIVLTVCDDGKGINPEVIKQKALEKELFTEQELSSMSQMEIVNIIFHSGFSTAEVVSDLSGRGVGMDMVRGSFEDMGGSVFVNSKFGEGSKFTLRVPIPKSVLIINSLLVETSNSHFIFHMDEVSEVVRYEKETQNSKMYELDGKKVLNHNGTMVQLIHLDNVLRLKASEVDYKQGDVINIVVLRLGETKFGVVVDQIYEFEEVVSRKISNRIESKDMYLGASLIGSGEVALILSAQGIAERCQISLNLENNSKYEFEDDETNVQVEGHEYMLFKYDPDKYLAVDLDNVERLEKIKPSEVKQVGEHFAIRYLDKVLPLVEPASEAALNQFDYNSFFNSERDFIELIVVNVDNMKFALLVHELDEIKVTSEEVNQDTIVDEGILGSVYINDKTICVVDLEFVAKKFKSKKKIIHVEEINLKSGALDAA